MDRYVVIGHPIEHSRSPRIHAEFARQTGQPLVYERLLSPLDGFAATVRALAEGGARGCNITMPFKHEAWALAAQRTPRAERAGAANTLRFDAGGWWADNTDGVGLVRDLAVNAGVMLRGARVLLLGAGGAAAGVLGPLIEAAPAQLVLANRTPERARELALSHAALADACGVQLLGCGLDTLDAQAGCAPYDVLINATAASMHTGSADWPGHWLRPGTLALDMAYGAAAQPFLAWAQAHGATGRDGLGMLVEQAAESFFDWRGVHPETAPVLALLRADIAAGR